MKSHKQFQPALQKIGEKIYYNRVLKNLSTKQFASMISLTPEALRKIEKGESDPSITTILLIASKLGLELAQVMKEINRLPVIPAQKKGNVSTANH